VPLVSSGQSFPDGSSVVSKGDHLSNFPPASSGSASSSESFPASSSCSINPQRLLANTCVESASESPVLETCKFIRLQNHYQTILLMLCQWLVLRVGELWQELKLACGNPDSNLKSIYCCKTKIRSYTQNITIRVVLCSNVTI
jgi:hypothetical protein